jgi:hypothetical protein
MKRGAGEIFHCVQDDKSEVQGEKRMGKTMGRMGGLMDKLTLV